MPKKYETVIHELLFEIEEAVKNAVTTLPTEMTLCEKYNVSRQTLRKAADQLISEGLIYRRKGSGCHLTEKALRLRERNVALIIDNDSEYTNPLLISGLYDALKIYGITLTVHITNGRYNDERKIYKELLVNLPDALLIKPIRSAIPNPNTGYINNFIEKEIPVFFIEDSPVSTNSEYCAYKNEYSSGFDMATYLINNDLTQIGTLLKIDEKAGLVKFKGINDSAESSSVDIKDNNIGWYSDNNIEKLRKKTDTSFISEYLEKISSTCSCIICQNDEIAYWTAKLTNMSEYKKDILIVSFDNTYLANFGNIAFMSVPFNYNNYCSQIAQNINRVFMHQRPNLVSFDWDKPNFKI